MRFRPFYPLFITAFLFSAPTWAQFGLPDAFLDKIPVHEMPAVDNATLAAEELALRRPGRPQTFAVAHGVSIRPGRQGIWTEVGGEARWYARVRSAGAYSLNLGFSEYRLPEGAELYLRTPTETQGPFTPADNEEHNQFWTPILDGDELLIELRLPAETKGKEQLYLTSVNHDFMNVSASVSGSCNIDVACGFDDGFGIVDRYRDIIRSVASYSLNGINQCTGFLVNNTSEDGTPLFMTANHCNVNQSNAPSLVTYWRYQNSFCRTPGGSQSGQRGNGPRNIINSGSILLASFELSDMTLTQLDDPVNPQADAFYAGWDRRNALPQDTLIAIHHPNVEEKRIAISYNPTRRVNFGEGPSDVNGRLLEITRWTLGTTEPGSSGSPVFDRFKRVRGQLFAGSAGCDNPSGYDVYGYLPVSWFGGGAPSNSLVEWLDPCGTGAQFIDGLDSRVQDRQILAATGNCVESCSRVETNLPLNVGTAYPAGSSVQLINADPGLSASLSTTTVRGGDVVTVVIPADVTRPNGTYTLTARVSGGGFSDDVDLRVDMVSVDLDDVRLQTPASNATGVSVLTDYRWRGVDNAQSYEIEIATDQGFTNVVARGGILGTAATLNASLLTNTTYFWRVRPVGVCGPGDWDTDSFTTDALACSGEAAAGLPLSISPAGPNTVAAEVDVPFDGDLEDVVVEVFITHSYVGDLRATLTDPDGVSIELFSGIGGGSCSEDNLDLTFSDEAPFTNDDLRNSCSTAGGFAARGEFQAAGSLVNTFRNSSLRGRWTLTVFDEVGGDGGNLETFRLTFCGDLSTSTTDFADDRDVAVYPNPTTGLLSVEPSGTWHHPIEAHLLDATGRALRTFGLTGVSRQTLDLSDLPNGVYFLRLQSGAEGRTERVVVLR